MLLAYYLLNCSLHVCLSLRVCVCVCVCAAAWQCVRAHNCSTHISTGFCNYSAWQTATTKQQPPQGVAVHREINQNMNNSQCTPSPFGKPAAAPGKPQMLPLTTHRCTQHSRASFRPLAKYQQILRLSQVQTF